MTDADESLDAPHLWSEFNLVPELRRQGPVRLSPLGEAVARARRSATTLPLASDRQRDSDLDPSIGTGQLGLA